MITKKKFELIYGKSGEVYNVLPINHVSLKPFEVEPEDAQYIKNLVRMYTKMRKALGYEYVLSNLDKCHILNLEEYPLPAFINTEGNCYCNIAVLPYPNMSEMTTTDAYAIFLYALSNYDYSTKGKISDDSEEYISQYIFSVFMKMFGKKSGILGSYGNMIPKLHFIIKLYVHVSMFGNEDTIPARNRIANLLMTDYDTLRLDNFDFNSIDSILKCINNNNIIPLSGNSFSTEVVKYGGISSLPMFEDVSRFMATMLTSTISGNNLITTYWQKVNPNLSNKLLYIADAKLK